MKPKQPIESVRRDLALRYRLIETVAWWEGRLTTGHLIQRFGISQQQEPKNITPTSAMHAPKNLTYDKHLKGYACATAAPSTCSNTPSAAVSLPICGAKTSST